MCLSQVVLQRRIPFEIGYLSSSESECELCKNAIPNLETLKALEEVAEMEKCPEKYKTYKNVDEMFMELGV
ncbi:hypothetical protein FACS189465_1960 [Clostridia bacterium]|nr:hypothetical protein FACS189465_1960 [Clostridia bacterium]